MEALQSSGSPNPPIDRLPYDVLSLIFQHGVMDWEPGDWERISGMTTNSSHWYKLIFDFLLPITAVSRSWRKVALEHTPRIWRNIWLTKDPLFRKLEWSAYIRRSGAVRLNAWVEAGYLLDVAQELTSLDCLDRLRTLHISLSRGLWSAGALEDLGYLTCPRLEVLSLEAFHWVPPRSLVAFLWKYPTLRSLRLLDFSLSAHQPGEADCVILSQLESLQVDGDISSVIREFSNVILALNLTHLISTTRRINYPITTPLSFEPKPVRNASKSLRELSLGRWVVAEDICTMLSEMPNVTILQLFSTRSLSRGEFYATLWRALEREHPAQGALVPKLQSISFDNIAISFTALLRLVDRRLSFNPCLFKGIGLSKALRNKFSPAEVDNLEDKIETFHWRPPVQFDKY